MGQRPSFGDKLNGIVRFIEDPCDAPFLLYIELARAPAKKALLSFLTFGLADIMRGYFRPKGLRSRRHGRGGRKSGVGRSRLGRAVGRVPGLGDDLGNFIGKRLPGAERLNQRHVSQGVKNLWLVDGLLQRALFYWLIIGITTDFLYEWTSLIQKSEFCQRSKVRGGYSVGTMSGVLAIQGWQAIIGLVEQRNYGGLTMNLNGAALGSGRWTIVFALQMEQIGNPGTSAHECRLVNISTGESLGESGTETVDVGGVSSLIVIADIQGPMQVGVEARVSFGGTTGKLGDFWVTGD